MFYRVKYYFFVDVKCDGSYMLNIKNEKTGKPLQKPPNGIYPLKADNRGVYIEIKKRTTAKIKIDFFS